MFKRILVPLDGSRFAERALPHAEFFARVFDSKIVLLRVLDPIGEIDEPHPVDPITWQIREKKAEQYMQRISHRVAERISKSFSDEESDVTDSHRVEYVIRQGNPPENIIRFAHNEAIDLLVISTHGWGGFTRWNISSVTQKVIKRIYLPLLLVRTYEEKETPDGEIRYGRILMPLDSSPRSECAFSAGIRLIRGEIDLSTKETARQDATDSKKNSVEPALFLTTVIRPPEIPVPKPHGEDVQKLIDQFMLLSQNSVHKYLARIKLQFDVPSETRTIEHRSVSEALQRLVKEENIDLIIMSAHGYTGQYHYPYGSVAREMLEFGARPILIIQDIPRCHVQLTDSEIAAQQSEGRD
ncbi:MAG: universal stress protein [Desulfobacterium sp.]|jgi:nucleotide-binding universal stress UspA family protein|nr:universal stress protein [Desulfobacterium sp.]